MFGLEPLLAPKFHLSVSFAAAQAQQRLQAARCGLLVIYLREGKGMLCTPLPFGRLEPLLAPKQHRSVYAAAAQAQQRLRAARCGVRTDLFGSKQENTESLTRCFLVWSGLRGSNPPPSPWQGDALPNELNPHRWCLRSESNQRHGDFQSPALPTELQRLIKQGLLFY